MFGFRKNDKLVCKLAKILGLSLKTAAKKCLVLCKNISFPSGACIPLANKCNSKIDCFEDESDESHCSYLEV